MQSCELGQGKGLGLAAEPSRIKLCWVPTGLVIVVYRGSTQHDDCIEECRGGKTTRCTTDSRVSSVDEKFEGATPVSGHQYFCSERLTAWIWRNNKPGDWSEHCCRHHNRVSLGTKRANVGSVNMGKNGFLGTFHLLELASQTGTSRKENSTINHNYSTGFVYS